jgi:hypothetical protein
VIGSPPLSYQQIRIGRFAVGLSGLNEAFTTLYKEGFEPDESVVPALMAHVRQQNYVPPAAEAEYVEALLREFRRFCEQMAARPPARGDPVVSHRPRRLVRRLWGVPPLLHLRCVCHDRRWQGGGCGAVQMRGGLQRLRAGLQAGGHRLSTQRSATSILTAEHAETAETWKKSSASLRSRGEIKGGNMVRQARIMSNWLRGHIRERGGAFNITTRLVVVG